MSAVGALVTHDAECATHAADIAGALSLEAMEGTGEAYDPRLHAARPHHRQADLLADRHPGHRQVDVGVDVLDTLIAPVAHHAGRIRRPGQALEWARLLSDDNRDRVLPHRLAPAVLVLGEVL